MHKKIFLLDKCLYREDIISSLSENDLEERCLDEDDYSIIKIDASKYNCVEEALKEELILFPEDYYIFTFGF